MNAGVYVGGGYLGLLTLSFIGLKLTGYIDWSWLWILAPLWIPIVLLLLNAVAYVVMRYVYKV